MKHSTYDGHQVVVITEEVIIDVQNMKYVQSSSSHLSLLPVSLFVWSAVTSLAVKNWLDSFKVSEMTAVKELSQKNQHQIRIVKRNFSGFQPMLIVIKIQILKVV